MKKGNNDDDDDDGDNDNDNNNNHNTSPSPSPHPLLLITPSCFVYLSLQTSVPVNAPCSGVIQEFFVEEGDTVPVGGQLFRMTPGKQEQKEHKGAGTLEVQGSAGASCCWCCFFFCCLWGFFLSLLSCSSRLHFFFFFFFFFLVCFSFSLSPSVSRRLSAYELKSFNRGINDFLTLPLLSLSLPPSLSPSLPLALSLSTRGSVGRRIVVQELIAGSGVVG